MASQNLFTITCAILCITIALASHHYLPVSHTSANLGNIPVDGHPGYAPGLDYFAYPRYNYRYQVADPITGDYKHHTEERDGANVRGSYGLVEPNGAIRHVDYIADVNGFRANVRRSPGAHVSGPVRGPVFV